MKKSLQPSQQSNHSLACRSFAGALNLIFVLNIFLAEPSRSQNLGESGVATNTQVSIGKSFAETSPSYSLELKKMVVDYHLAGQGASIVSVLNEPAAVKRAFLGTPTMGVFDGKLVVDHQTYQEYQQTVSNFDLPKTLDYAHKNLGMSASEISGRVSWLLPNESSVDFLKKVKNNELVSNALDLTTEATGSPLDLGKVFDVAVEFYRLGDADTQRRLEITEKIKAAQESIPKHFEAAFRQEVVDGLKEARKAIEDLKKSDQTKAAEWEEKLKAAEMLVRSNLEESRNILDLNVQLNTTAKDSLNRAQAEAKSKVVNDKLEIQQRLADLAQFEEFSNGIFKAVAAAGTINSHRWTAEEKFQFSKGVNVAKAAVEAGVAIGRAVLAGAAGGSVVGPIGTAVGAVVGFIAALFSAPDETEQKFRESMSKSFEQVFKGLEHLDNKLTKISKQIEALSNQIQSLVMDVLVPLSQQNIRISQQNLKVSQEILDHQKTVMMPLLQKIDSNVLISHENILKAVQSYFGIQEHNQMRDLLGLVEECESGVSDSLNEKRDVCRKVVNILNHISAKENYILQESPFHENPVIASEWRKPFMAATAGDNKIAWIRFVEQLRGKKSASDGSVDWMADEIKLKLVANLYKRVLMSDQSPENKKFHKLNLKKILQRLKTVDKQSGPEILSALSFVGQKYFEKIKEFSENLEEAGQLNGWEMYLYRDRPDDKQALVSERLSLERAKARLETRLNLEPIEGIFGVKFNPEPLFENLARSRIPLDPTTYGDVVDDRNFALPKGLVDHIRPYNSVAGTDSEGNKPAEIFEARLPALDRLPYNLAKTSPHFMVHNTIKSKRSYGEPKKQIFGESQLSLSRWAGGDSMEFAKKEFLFETTNTEEWYVKNPSSATPEQINAMFNRGQYMRKLSEHLDFSSLLPKTTLENRAEVFEIIFNDHASFYRKMELILLESLWSWELDPNFIALRREVKNRYDSLSRKNRPYKDEPEESQDLPESVKLETELFKIGRELRFYEKLFQQGLLLLGLSDSITPNFGISGFLSDLKNRRLYLDLLASDIPNTQNPLSVCIMTKEGDKPLCDQLTTASTYDLLVNGFTTGPQENEIGAKSNEKGTMPHLPRVLRGAGLWMQSPFAKFAGGPQALFEKHQRWIEEITAQKEKISMIPLSESIGSYLAPEFWKLLNAEEKEKFKTPEDALRNFEAIK